MVDRATLPLFPLGTVLYPGALLPIHVFEARYRQLMSDRADDDPIFGVVLTKHGREVGDQPEIFEVGTAASLIGKRRYADGRYDLAVRGGRRFRAVESDWGRSYLVATVEWLDPPVDDTKDDPFGYEPEAVRLRDDVMQAFSDFLDAIVNSSGTEMLDERFPWNPTDFGYAIAARLPIDNRERQRLLEAPTSNERLRDLLAILRRERALLLGIGSAGAALRNPGLGFSPN